MVLAKGTSKSENTKMLCLCILKTIFFLGLCLGAVYVITAQNRSYDRELLEVTARVMKRAAMPIDETIGPLTRKDGEGLQVVRDFLDAILVEDGLGLAKYADNKVRLNNMIGDLDLPANITRYRVGIARQDGDFSVVKIKLITDSVVVVLRLAIDTKNKTIISIERAD